MKDNWLVKNQNEKLSKKISSELGISTITSQVLINRGIKSSEEAKLFLTSSLFDLPSPFLMKDMDKAVDRIVHAIENSQMICIYGDYDVDGVTSTALLFNFLKEIGARVTYYNPDRISEGYGIHFESVVKLKEQGVKLIVSGDCGITARDVVARARELGVDFIITDHHQPPDQLPDACAVLNPNLKDCQYPGKEITGVGVIFNLTLALRRRLRDDGYFNGKEPNLGDYLDLVALGTVADCASLTNVNRIFVKEGMKRMYLSKRPGISALKEVSSVQKEVSAYDIGFRLGPRINASGRLNTARNAVELLISNNPVTAREIADILNQENNKRQFIESRILEEVVTRIEEDEYFKTSRSIVLSSKHWHQGVIGIVASRIVDKYNKPAFLIAIDENGYGKGSGRSLSGVNIYKVLQECGEVLEEFGGHELAAGISIKESRIDEFSLRFDDAVSKLMDRYVKMMDIDVVVDLNQITGELVSELDKLSPYGIGNPQPVFMTSSAEILSLRRIKDKHLRLTLKNGSRILDAIWFNTDYEPATGKPMDIVYAPEINRWNGSNKIRLLILDADQ